MDIISQYKEYLFSQRHHPSKITVKNYLSDIRKFILWYENRYSHSFSPSSLTSAVIQMYENDLLSSVQSANLSKSSQKRYISSLHKFGGFLAHSGAIEANPFSTIKPAVTIEDPWKLKLFRNSLIDSKASSLTIKNYLIDIRQFLDWISAVTRDDTTQVDRFTYIDIQTIAQYKERLLNEKHFSPISINRKLSSLRRYFRWLYVNNLLKEQPQIDDISQKKDIQSEVAKPIEPPTVTRNLGIREIPLSALQEIYPQNSPETTKTYSRFGPLRFFQKVSYGFSKGFDILFVEYTAKAVEAIQYSLWKRSGKKIFVPVEGIIKATGTIPEPEKIAISTGSGILGTLIAKTSPFLNYIAKSSYSQKRPIVRNISKEFYAPLEISLKSLPFHKRLYHHIKYTRPAWYKKYHSFPIVHHIHTAILLFAMCVSTIGTIMISTETTLSKSSVNAEQQNSPPRTIAFQGRLLDNSNSPISAENNLRFTIYNSPTASDAAQLWQEVQHITPDNDGYFSTVLGKKVTINQNLFSDNANLYVGITIGNDTELKPRQQLPTTTFSANSQTLQGLKAITKTTKTEDVILALDSTGNLTIGGTANPTFQAVGGQFTLSGQTLLLTTNTDSNGNITISPDGSGIIDMQKPIQNTSQYDNPAGVPGAVNIADILAVSTTETIGSAVTIRQNGTGDIITGYNGTTPKFIVDNLGNTTIEGRIQINGNTITSNNTSFGILNNNVTTLNIGNNADYMSIGGTKGNTIINNNLTVKGSLTYEGSLDIKNSLSAGGGITIPAGKSLTIMDLKPGTIPFINTLNQITQDANLTWDTTNKVLQTTGSLCVRAVSTACPASTPGTIYASNTTVQAADVAENYISANPLEPGDIVMPEGSGDNSAIKKTDKEYQTQVIGIISTNPGFTLNSDAKPNTQHPYVYPMALQGRVPVKVTSINGDIKAGDPLTTSSIPGVAMLATKPGHIIAKALEDYSNTDKTAVTKIVAFVNASYSNPLPYISEKGIIPTEMHPTPQAQVTEQDIDTTTLGKPIKTMYSALLTIDNGVITAKNITTNTLKIVSENVTINGEPLTDYVTRIITTNISKPTVPAQTTARMPIAPQQDASFATPLPELHATRSGIVDVPSDNKLTASDSGTPIYNSIASQSGHIVPASSSADMFEPITSETTPTASATPIIPIQLPPSALFMTPEPALIATNSAELGIDKLDAHEVTISKTLSVAGRTVLSDVGITGSATIGLMNINGLANEEGTSYASISTSSGPLMLQPQGFNGIDMMNGKLSIDTKGNLKLNGNAVFAKDVTIKGTLSANTIAPIPGSDLVFSIGKTQHNEKLSVNNADGQTVLHVNQKGDLRSSGSGQFANITIVRGAQADTSLTQTIAHSSAGNGIIKARQTERTILTNYVTKNSLIYVTATSDTQRAIPYVARQSAHNPATNTNGSFTVQIPSGVSKDITFNWWIVN